MNNLLKLQKAPTLINYNHNEFKLMLKSNNTNPQVRCEIGPKEDTRIFKPSSISTQFHRATLKENDADFSPSFRGSKNITQTTETEQTKQNSWLQSTRNKYENTKYFKQGTDSPTENTPLKDSKRVNRIIYADTKKENEPELQRSFSFVNKQPIQMKPQTSIALTSQWRDEKGTNSDQKGHLRKNSSEGLFEDVRFKFGGSTGSKYANQIKSGHYQCTDTPVSEFKLNEAKPRTISQYKKMTQQVNTINIRQTDEILHCGEASRIQSIDRINIKIKQIRKYINQTQKPQTQYSANLGTNTNYRLKGHIQQQKTAIACAHTELLKTSSYSKPLQKKFTEETQKSTYIRTPTETFEAQRKAMQQKHSIRIKTQQGNPSTAKSNILRQSDIPQKRLGGKDLDQQIRKIQDKIKKTEQQKVKLNIRFEEFKISTPLRAQPTKSASISKNLNTYNYKYQIYSQKKAYEKTEAYKPPLRKTTYSPHSQKKENTQTKSMNHDLVPPAEPFNIKVFKVQCQEQPNPTELSNKFIDNLKEQVRLDEQFRNAKRWLQNCDLPDKWGQIQSELKANGVQKSIGQVKQQFESSLQEHNPFYSARSITYTMKQITQKYLACQIHWNASILKCFDSKQLQAENFTENKLDLQRKGYLTVQDFVRFLNIETGTFYRNRDLILAFRRLATDKLNFKQMLQTIAK